MTFGWPLRIVVLIGALFLIDSFWSISRVSVSPLPVNHNMPKFSDIDLSKAPRNEDYQNGVRRGFEGVKRECTAATLGEFAHAITWFYIDAVVDGEARRGRQHRGAAELGRRRPQD